MQLMIKAIDIIADEAEVETEGLTTGQESSVKDCVLTVDAEAILGATALKETEGPCLRAEERGTTETGITTDATGDPQAARLRTSTAASTNAQTEVDANTQIHQGKTKTLVLQWDPEGHSGTLADPQGARTEL